MTHTLSTAELASFADELDALRAEVVADLGQRDVDHVRRMIRLVRYGEAVGRALLHVGLDPLTFVVGAAALGAAKILENMEVGHNVMHGQYDWTGDPALRGHAYEWDIVCTGDAWRHAHNYEHHTFTNILGKDRDIGYRALRISGEQRWQPHHLVQPVVAVLLALWFQWGGGMHDLRIPETLAGEQSRAELGRRAKPFLAKAAWQLAKDYLAFPLLAGLNAPRVLAGNLAANLMRNLWTFAVIFCGHFPAGVQVFPPSAAGDERPGAWYLRQLHGSANIDGGTLFHLATGHLSHQIEHHLFPDLPAARYPEIAPRVRAICAKYGQPYLTGRFAAQLASVGKQLLAGALPPRAWTVVKRARAGSWPRPRTGVPDTGSCER